MSRVRSAIRKNLPPFVSIVVLVGIAAFVAIYILGNQRLHFPWQPSTLELKAELPTAQAVTPGQGQTVRVSGVKVGSIEGVDLVDGRGVITLAIDDKYRHLIHTDATALLRPKTGLKDMFLEVDPGSRAAPVAQKDFTIPIQNTLSDVNLDQILAELDTDTRAYVMQLVNGAAHGLKGRGDELREVFKRFEPTHRDLAEFATAVAKRRDNLRRLVHSLDTLSGALADRRQQISTLISTSATVFRALASENHNISQAVRDLPATLRQTTATLQKVEAFADQLAPAARDLQPAARALTNANQALTPFAKDAAPIIRTKIRPFVRDARPVVRSLQEPAKDLSTATPDLTRTFVVLNHLFNMLGYNPNKDGKPIGGGDDASYLFWLAWLDHQATNLFSGQDANGFFRPLTIAAPCNTVQELINEVPQLEFLLNLDPILFGSGACGKQPSQVHLPSLNEVKLKLRKADRAEAGK